MLVFIGSRGLGVQVVEIRAKGFQGLGLRLGLWFKALDLGFRRLKPL